MNGRCLRWGSMKIHPSACIVMAVILFSGRGVMLAAYIGALIWHEGAHCMCAKGMGYRMPEMEWTPFGASARLEDWHHVPYGRQLLIAAAGPLASLLGALLWRCLLDAAPLQWQAIAIHSYKANVYLLGFNLFPVLPMDGGRLLYAAAACRWDRQRAGRMLSWAGMWLGAFFVLLGIWAAVFEGVYNLTLPIAGCFLAYSAGKSTQTAAGAALRSMVEKHILIEKRGRLSVQWMAMDCRKPVRWAVQQMEPGIYHRILLMDPHLGRTVGQIDEETLNAALLDDQERTLISLVK